MRAIAPWDPHTSKVFAVPQSPLDRYCAVRSPRNVFKTNGCPGFGTQRIRHTLWFTSETVDKMKSSIIGPLFAAAVSAIPMPAPAPVSYTEHKTFWILAANGTHSPAFLRPPRPRPSSPTLRSRPLTMMASMTAIYSRPGAPSAEPAILGMIFSPVLFEKID